MTLPRLLDTALEGMGASLPPHISIQGNGFTLIDRTGAEKLVEVQGPDGKMWKSPYLDVVIADMGGVSKQFYGQNRDWSPDSADAPICFSANGVTPDASAQQRQARTCAECQWNVRGSAVSKMSGAAIKACRDERWLAIIVAGPIALPDMLFRYVLTPGSFANWRAYIQKFQGQNIDLTDVVTRFAFAQGQNGVLTFEAVDHAGPERKALVEKAHAEGKTAEFVGRDQGAPALPPPSAPQPPQLAAPPPPANPFGAGAAAPAPVFGAPVSPPPSEAPGPGRGRRKKAAAAPQANGQAPVAPFPHGQPAAPPAATPAAFQPQPGPLLPHQVMAGPFGAAPNAAPQSMPTATPPQQPPGSPSFAAPAAASPSNPAPFGIGQGAPPNAELAAMLDAQFPRKA